MKAIQSVGLREQPLWCHRNSNNTKTRSINKVILNGEKVRLSSELRLRVRMMILKVQHGMWTKSRCQQTAVKRAFPIRYDISLHAMRQPFLWHHTCGNDYYINWHPSFDNLNRTWSETLVRKIT